MEAIWYKDVPRVEFDELCGNKSTEVLIIGGGIAGITCARKLKNEGVDCMLVEAKGICDGITGNTTAKITFAHGLIYDKMIKRFGEKMARLYLQAQKKAINDYCLLAADIDCDFEKRAAYVYSVDNRKKLEREVAALRRLGVEAELSSADELPLKVAGAVRVSEQAQFNPLKFLYSVAKGLPIYEHTKLTELKPHKAITDKGEISYKKLIIATHFPMLNKHGGYFLKLYQHRSYVLALKGAPSIEGMYVDECDKGLSFRGYRNLLLLGGGGHRTGKQGGGWKELEAFAGKYYKSARVVGKWATQDCMTLDGIPYIGQYSSATPDLFVITGFNKWGMTGSMVAADLISDLVKGSKNPYSAVFSPSRSILRPRLFTNTFEAALGLLTPTAPRCPHLGCALKYNAAEHSWDCPCHGSRFAENGELIDNPSTADGRFTHHDRTDE